MVDRKIKEDRMKFQGSAKQIKWAEEIWNDASLTIAQQDALLRIAGPTLYSAGIMPASIVIDQRKNLSAYADSAARFMALAPAEKHAVAVEVAAAMGAYCSSRR